MRMTCFTWVMFMAVDFVVGVLFPMKQIAGHNVLAWSSGANAIVAVSVGFLASSAPWRRLQLALALSAVPLAIQVVNVIEGVIFLKVDTVILWSLAASPLKYALIVPLWAAIFRPAADSPPRYPVLPTRTIGGMLWRFVLCDFIYLIIYFVAGIFVISLPFVRDFYATQTMPSLGQVVALQLLLRGPVFVGVCALLARMMGRPGLFAAVTVGLSFTLISGVAPLIQPSPFFPDPVRWVHFCEVTGSNLLFGIVVALIWPKRPAAELPESAAA